MTTNIARQIAAHEAEAERHQDDINHLVLRYGDGVRPSWVGEDIGIAAAHRDEHLRAAETLRRKSEAA